MWLDTLLLIGNSSTGGIDQLTQESAVPQLTAPASRLRPQSPADRSAKSHGTGDGMTVEFRAVAQGGLRAGITTLKLPRRNPRLSGAQGAIARATRISR